MRNLESSFQDCPHCRWSEQDSSFDQGVGVSGMKLQGRTAIVTGGSRGIGAAIARRFAAEGADVALTYVGNAEAAGRVVSAIKAAGRKALAIKADASDPVATGRMLEQVSGQLGPLDIIVHSAGVSEFIGLADTSAADYADAYQRHFTVNVGGVVALTAAAVPHMRDNGRIIIIGSVNAHQMPFPGTAIYDASKAAAAALARSWARDLGPRGILTNVIQPGPIETEMNPNDEREVVKAMTAMTALKRYGRVEEIAALAAFLASDESSYITGTTIDIDGGFSV